MLEAVGTKVKMVCERALRCQLHHHAEGAECDANQGDDPRVVQVAHDGQLLTKVLVLLQENIMFVWSLEYLHCHRISIIRSQVYLQSKEKGGRVGGFRGGGEEKEERRREEGEGKRAMSSPSQSLPCQAGNPRLAETAAGPA